MKKILGSLLSVSLCFGLFACNKKTDSKTNKKTTNKTSATTTTKAKTTSMDINTDNPEYQSTFTPIVSDSLPRIDINSNDNSTDFATVPTRENKWDYVGCKVSVTNGSEVELNAVAAGVKARGNYTVNNPKKPFRIKFEKKQSMLGLHDGEKYKSWLLLAAYKDWSYLRDATAFYLAHKLSDDYVSDFRLVNLYINNQFWGVYLLCEQQEVKSGRVSITEPWMLEDETYYTGTEIGYFLEYDGYYYEEAALEQFTVNYRPIESYDETSISEFQNGFTIKSDIYSEAQNTFIKNYMQKTFDICYDAILNNEYYEFNSTYSSTSKSSTIKNSYEAISKVVDIDSLVNAYILAEITCDADFAYSSFYMDVDFGENGDKLLRFEAPWDYDSGFGNTIACLDAEGIYAANVLTYLHGEKHMNPWYALFMHADWFRQLVKDK
ncbi:MAG: CotH kinase family protein, partial [bacterium]|nr:CotH kinase family protein [bacterium]